MMQLILHPNVSSARLTILKLNTIIKVTDSIGIQEDKI